MFQEFPKSLQRGEEFVIAMSADEEAAARKQGYTFARDEPEPAEPKKRPGRPPKAKE